MQRKHLKRFTLFPSILKKCGIFGESIEKSRLHSACIESILQAPPMRIIQMK